MDATWSEAAREAYASAPANDPLLDTLEIQHPSFTEPIRLVRDHLPLVARLEDGQEVSFVAGMFDFGHPSIEQGGTPRVEISVINVSGRISDALNLAVTQPEPIAVVYRAYLPSDLSGPQNDPPLRMQLDTVRATLTRVTAQASLSDSANLHFPAADYQLEQWPGLAG